MENMGKHEYMKSINVKTWMFFWFGKNKGFHTHVQKKKKHRPTQIFFLCYDKQTFFYA